jgi:hypothetical protein
MDMAGWGIVRGDEEADGIGGRMGALAGAPMRSVAPQEGQRAFLPAEVAGAFSFLPQAHWTTMEFSPDMMEPSE